MRDALKTALEARIQVPLDHAPASAGIHLHGGGPRVPHAVEHSGLNPDDDGVEADLLRAHYVGVDWWDRRRRPGPRGPSCPRADVVRAVAICAVTVRVVVVALSGLAVSVGRATLPAVRGLRAADLRLESPLGNEYRHNVEPRG
jgi:hypothetical protein